MFIVAIFLNKLQINEKKLVLVIILNSLKQSRSPSAKPFLEREPHHNTNCKANSADLCTCCQRNNPAAMQNKLTLEEKIALLMSSLHINNTVLLVSSG